MRLIHALLLSAASKPFIQEQLALGLSELHGEEAAVQLLDVIADPDTGVSAAAKLSLESIATTPEGQIAGLHIIPIASLSKPQG